MGRGNRVEVVQGLNVLRVRTILVLVTESSASRAQQRTCDESRVGLPNPTLVRRRRGTLYLQRNTGAEELYLRIELLL